MKKLTLFFIGFICAAGILYGNENKITTVPLFRSCGIYFETADMSTPCVTEFQEKGSDKWEKALELMAIPTKEVGQFPLTKKETIYTDKAMFRGCIVNLKENTEYELRITQGENTSASTFKTWSTEVPAGKTINVKDLKFDDELIIIEKGSRDAWIKYTSDKGFVLKGNDKKNAVITVKGGEYIIFENLNLEGGARHGISLEGANNIRILNCDISGYGRIGKQDIKKDGKYYIENKIINNDAGVNIDKSGNIVIERCYIHDPRGHANSWKYSHPAGPNAVAVLSTGGTVLRYNDFIGSDAHRWNDTVEGIGNGLPKGGFYRDAEIYGNMFIYANDDGIELDGGQMNIRVFLNKFEGSLCGISTAPCLLGPSYLFRNLIVNLADEDGYGAAAFKNGHNSFDRGRCYVFNNTVYAPGGYGHYNNNKDEIAKYGKELRGITRNNIFYSSKELFSPSVFNRGNDFDYDLIFSKNSKLLKSTEENLKEKGWEEHGIFEKDPEFSSIEGGIFTLTEKSPARENGVSVDNFIEKQNNENPDRGAFQTGNSQVLPYRPIPVYLDKYQINFKFDFGKDVMSQTFNASVTGVEKFSEAFEIKKNNVFDWFTIEPSRGILNEKSNIRFKVSINKDKIKKPGFYRGLFLLKLENGYSRPVTVYAQTDGTEEIKKKSEQFALYIEAEKSSIPHPFNILDDSKASEGKCAYLDIAEKAMPLSYDFEVPQDADYQIFVRVKSEEPVGQHDSIFLSLDDTPKREAYLRSDIDWKWSGCGATTSLGTTAKPFSLKKGKHNIKFFPRETLFIDILLITNDYKVVY
ncbi:MAG: hypothetical protein A2020_06835 [Lentisphaerae bacterium GWF2_45_14]|nr:MAG: hypothetical protein A2020_06835 [Lentisphaerae bacterium GWF2_45_14]